MKKYVVSLPRGENIESSIDLRKLQPDLSAHYPHRAGIPRTVEKGRNVLNPGPQGQLLEFQQEDWKPGF